jgi:uncharacterized RDD family membrane protein YckC
VSTDARVTASSDIRAISHVAPARLLRRLLAFGLDAIVVSVAILLAAAAMSAILGPALRLDLAHPEPPLRVIATYGRPELNALVAMALSATYFAGSWWTMAATPGQRLLGIRVPEATTAALRLTAGAALLRWIVLFPPFGLAAALAADLRGLSASLTAAGVLWGLVLLISTVRRADRRGLHDRAAGSIVVRR